MFHSVPRCLSTTVSVLQINTHGLRLYSHCSRSFISGFIIIFFYFVFVSFYLTSIWHNTLTKIIQDDQTLLISSCCCCYSLVPKSGVSQETAETQIWVSVPHTVPQTQMCFRGQTRFDLDYVPGE